MCIYKFNSFSILFFYRPTPAVSVLVGSIYVICIDSYIDVELGLDYWNRTKVRFKNKHLDNELLTWRLNGQWAYLKYFYTYTYTVRVNLEEQNGMIFHSAGAGNRSDTIPVEVERSEWNLYIFWPFPSGGANIFSPKIGFLSSASWPKANLYSQDSAWPTFSI